MRIPRERFASHLRTGSALVSLMRAFKTVETLFISQALHHRGDRRQDALDRGGVFILPFVPAGRSLDDAGGPQVRTASAHRFAEGQVEALERVAKHLHRT